MMAKSQWIVLSSVMLLFSILYFGLNNKSSNRGKIDRTRSLTAESTDIGALLPPAKAELSPDNAAIVGALEAALAEAQNDSSKIELIEQLSGNWYRWGRPDISGYYAEQIALKINSARAWSIAGTTYAIGTQRSSEDKVRTFCTGRAVKAFENAISLEPENIDHRLNLAVCLADNPPANNPMRGIKMLLDLNTQNPEEVKVLNTLARFGLQTGQFEKAVQRLEKVLTIDPANQTAICLLSKAYEGLGQTAKAAGYAEKCQSAR
ncbi:MAG: tetratricopeptide repeat protein [Bacteroidota bacterium]